MEVNVEFKTGRNEILPNGMSICEIQAPAANIRQYLYLPFDEYHRYFGAPEGVAADLVVVAGSCYLIDQLITRSSFSDQWTRELEVNIQVEDVDRWASVATPLSETLSFLTGDRWQFSFSSRTTRIYKGKSRNLQRMRLNPASIICLFSGGVDSLAGAIDVLTQTQEGVTLVGHYDGTGATLQQDLAQKLKQQFPRRVNFIQNRVGAVSTASPMFGGLSPTNENTLRSRSFIFLALAVYIACQNKTNPPAPVLIPENGFIALNPPLTDARLGSYSTRTVHPRFIAKVQEVLVALGIGTTITNPLVEKTKGEVLASSANRQLLLSLVPETVSCAHPQRRQGWNRKNASHCGYCVPCIFRQAALHKVGLEEIYGIDAFGGELPLDADIAADVRAVLSFVSNVQMGEIVPERLVSQLMLPIDQQAAFARLIRAEAEEVTQLLRDKADTRIKQWSGIA